MVQGFNGAFSHTGVLAYSIDWQAPVGVPIYASRAGFVDRVKSDSNETGKTSKFKDKANYVSIIHDDHSIGQYLHIKYRGACVKPGQEVKKGQLIAYSGNTGWSTFPHIHFHVYVCRPYIKEGWTTIPILFDDGKDGYVPKRKTKIKKWPLV